MEIQDEELIKFEHFIKKIAKLESFGKGTTGDDLSVEQLDMVTGGHSAPDYRSFMKYVAERDKKSKS